MSSSDLTGSREIFQQMWKDGQKDNKKTIKLLEENTGNALLDINQQQHLVYLFYI